MATMVGGESGKPAWPMAVMLADCWQDACGAHVVFDLGVISKLPQHLQP